MGYRQKFKKYYEVEFGPDYDVHHIDLNHYNDDIGNLMVLPKKLHHQYHFTLGCLPIENGNISIDIILKGISQSGNGWNAFTLRNLERFVTVYCECQKWMDYKHYLDGDIPNIHGIRLGGVAR